MITTTTPPSRASWVWHLASQALQHCCGVGPGDWHRAELSALERDEYVAEWIKLAEEEAKLKSVQSAPKSKSASNPKGSGRRAAGVLAASRDLGIESTDAKRAVKVASLTHEAKEATRDVGRCGTRLEFRDADLHR